MKTKFLIAILVSLVVISVGIAASVGMDRIPAKVTPSGVEINVLQKTMDSSPVIESDDSGLKRVIVPTTSAIDKVIFRLKGCKILHELNDATALKCPKDITIIGARPDRIFYIMDSEANIQINADDVWELDYDGTGVNVAVLDTGIDTDHLELSDSIVGCETFVDGITTCEDDHGHGTHVSGIITANGIDSTAKGVAPNAGILMGKVCGPIGDGYGCYDSDIEAGIEWAVEQGADVISISLGSYEVYGGEDCDWANDGVANKVNWAVSNGVVVVAASGNNYLSGVCSPACASGAIAVGAVNSMDEVAAWSNFGDALDLVAPGVKIYSTYFNNGYDEMSGTSMATPHVSGTAALILDKNSALTVDQIKAALYNTAKDLEGDKDANGRVDALGAVNYVSEEACTSNDECDDSNECTIDICNNPPDGTCSNTAVEDNTACIGGICCGGTCSVAACSADADCNDANTCTIDTCINQGTCSASCSYTEITQCTDGDGCCPVGCDSTIDSDCPEADCGDGDCAGKELGEDCITCPEDCPSKTHPRKGLIWCCGDGIWDKGENANNCPIDCI